MQFTFDATQQAFRESLDGVLRKHCTLEILRKEALADSQSTQDLRWGALAELGVVGLMIAPEFSGLGGNEIDMVLLQEEAGRFALPDPLIEVSLAAAPLLGSLRRDERVSAWLLQIASGQLIVSTLLSSTGPYVPFGSRAGLFIIEQSNYLYAVPKDDIRLHAQPTADTSRPLFAIETAVSSRYKIAEGEPARAASAAAFDRLTLGAAAQLLGLAERMIELATDHARIRHQFGRPIGSFQAVKHKLVDALLALEFARPVVYRAAWSLAEQAPDRHRDVSMAKIVAARAAYTASHASLQIHGALGYTWDYGLHFFIKRTWALASSWGAITEHRNRMVTALRQQLGLSPTSCP